MYTRHCREYKYAFYSFILPISNFLNSGGAVSGYDVPTCVTPTLLIQELNDQNLLRHNQLTSSSTFSDRMSSTDSSSTRNRAKPPPPQRSLGIESNKTTYAKTDSRTIDRTRP